ncbi:unnamed protein product [Soboliphyme baturini]|uniref:Phosphatidylserine decarboxylase n=1 Tax=Soboliphyme baturini TaxID=241478 RepID=A0A183J9T9_9BILA|nr:unnamed protein product [Soboliphyme baturini]
MKAVKFKVLWWPELDGYQAELGHLQWICQRKSEQLTTNRKNTAPAVQYENVYDPLILARKGEKIGEFNFGSSVVLVFEAPSDFQFTVHPGQRIKYGQPLGGVRSERDAQPPADRPSFSVD